MRPSPHRRPTTWIWTEASTWRATSPKADSHSSVAGCARPTRPDWESARFDRDRADAIRVAEDEDFGLGARAVRDRALESARLARDHLSPVSDGVDPKSCFVPVDVLR